MSNEELLERAIVLRQESEEIEKKLNFVNEQIKEMEQFTEKLNLLENGNEKEFLTNIGRRVYLKVDRRENEKLFVESGAGVVIRKTPKEAKEIVQEQIRKFNEAKIQLTEQLENYAVQFKEMIGEVERLKAKNEN